MSPAQPLGVGSLDRSSALCYPREMSIEAREGYVSVDKHRVNDDERREHRTFRLPRRHQEDLRDVAHGVEETNAGVCTKYLLDATAGGHEPDDVHLLEVERWCDRFKIFEHPRVASWCTRVRRTRRTLASMHAYGQSHDVAVLYVAYGPTDPLVREDGGIGKDWGELGSLARYTDAVEVRRVEMAKAEALHVSAAMVEWKPSRGGVGLRGLHQVSAYHETVAMMAVKHGMRATSGAAVVDLLRHRERYETAMARTTSAEALRDLQGHLPVQRPGETEGDFKRRQKAARGRRDVVLAQVKVEADQMLAKASGIYHSHWLQLTG